MRAIEPFADVNPAELCATDAERNRPVALRLLARHFPGCRIGGLGIFRLDPGQIHPVHTDDQPPEWVTRVHVPIETNPHATATTEAGPIHMEVGKAYRFDTTAPHAVANGGKTARLHLVFEVLR